MESCIATSHRLLPVSSKSQPPVHVKGTGPNIVGMPPLSHNIRKGELQTSTFQSSSRGINAKCAASASATETVKRTDRRTIVIPGMKDPKIDDNGPGLPPGDDSGSGGNGGGGGKFSGGLTLMGVLGVLDVLKDVESEWRKKDRVSYED